MTGDKNEPYGGGAVNWPQYVQTALSTGINYDLGLGSKTMKPMPTKDSLLEMANQVEQKAQSLLDILRQWDAITPSIERTRENAHILRVSLEHAPGELEQVSFQPLLEQLTLAVEAMEQVGSIPRPSSSTGPVFDTTASGTAFISLDYVNVAVRTFPDNPTVRNWGTKTRQRFQAIYSEADRRQDTRKRLRLLSPELERQYESAVNMTTKYTARLRAPSDAALEQRLVLEWFKGKLRGLCNGQARPPKHYALIAKELAANSPLTKNRVEKGQGEYDYLHQELTDIGKKKKGATALQMTALLEKIERHVLEITSALDPDLTGVRFS